MQNMGKIAAAIGGIAIIAAGAYFISQKGGDQGGDGGINVSNTPCDGIAAARQAVDDEYEDRIEKADSNHQKAMETASDNYWERYRELDDIKNACITDALMADPCKDAFEKSSSLAKVAIADPTDANTDAYHDAKQAWENCKADPPQEDTYEGKKAKCEADFNAGVEAAKQVREQAESQAASARDQAKAEAEQGKTSKHATLDAIEESCNLPPTQTAISVGGITTGGTGTVVQSGSPACTGNFQGHDPETQKEIDRLRSLLKQAQAAGKETGIGGIGSLSAKINDLRTEMLAGPKKCTSDSDCGDTEKVCCSETQVGWVKCSGGECANEKEDCEEDEVCSGKPAECVSGAEGAESSPIEISRVYIIGTPCNPTIQVLNLQKKDENSDRFEIVGNVPPWLGFSPVGGKLPKDVDVTVDCDTLQTEGTYEGSASVTVYDADNNLINTIPINVTIEAIKSILDEEDGDAVTAGDNIDLTDPEEGDGEAVTAGGDIDMTEEPEEEPEEEEPEEEPETTPKVADREYGFDELGKMTQDEIRALGDQIGISALLYNGKWFPFPGAQFVLCLSCPPMCEEIHYHGATGFSLDLQSVSEPPYSNCFWGRDIKPILATPDEIINWFHNRP